MDYQPDRALDVCKIHGTRYDGRFYECMGCSEAALSPYPRLPRLPSLGKEGDDLDDELRVMIRQAEPRTLVSVSAPPETICKLEELVKQFEEMRR